MKKILTYLVISASTFIFFSCDKPAPTQLIDDTNNELEVELLNKDLDDQYLTSGADTSGIIQDLTDVTDLISVSGIKITTAQGTRRLSLAQVMFFDEHQPIYYSNGKLLAYKTISRDGTIKFNELTARLDSFKVRYWDGGVQKVVSLGPKYVLYNLLWGLPDPFYFEYESSISFQFDPSSGGGNVSFNIPTPHEINGNVALTGTRSNKNLEAMLSWNGIGIKRVTLIIGLMRPNQKTSIPIYRIKTADDGELRIPGRYLNQLPLQNFEKIVFTFIRSYENYNGNGNSVLFVSSQSIHSIVIDIP